MMATDEQTSSDSTRHEKALGSGADFESEWGKTDRVKKAMARQGT